MDLRIRQLKIFLALAETLHFGKAAQQLYMSQPALTFQIQSMEATIGLQLFNRDRRRVELTTAGKNLVVTGKRIITELRQFEEGIDCLATEQPLRVVCAPSGEHIVLPAVIRQLRKIAPNVQIELCGLPPIEYLRALQENRIDVLLMVKKIETPGVNFQPITTQQLYAVVPESSEFARHGKISVHDFVKRPTVIAGRQHCDQTQTLIERMFLPFGVTPEFIEAPARQTARDALVAGGLGYALANEWRLAAPFPGVKRIPFEEQLPPLQLGAAWRSSVESPVLNSFRTALQDVIAELGRPKNQPLPVPSSRQSGTAARKLAPIIAAPSTLQARQA